MRSEQEMMQLFLSIAQQDQRIRLVGMEGSRTNQNVPKDRYQDYDISYIVTDMDAFTKSEDWLDVFGKRVIMQKPEAMSLFPPQMEWFSFLMILEDGIKIDLSIIPIKLLSNYLSSDRLLTILLDKDGLVEHPPVPTDEDYWIKKPSAAFFDDCCNEFWFVATYVAKGLCRDEILFASFHIEQIVRVQLLQMLSWQVGAVHGYQFSVGKNYKYIRKYLSDDQWSLLMQTYRLDSIDNCWQALDAAFVLFREAAQAVSNELHYQYPDYDENVTKHLEQMKLNSTK